jgi:hypothetical protein
MLSDDLALQEEIPLVGAPFKVSLKQGKQLTEAEETAEEAVEETTEQTPTTPITVEEDMLEAMASLAAKNLPSSRAIERTLSLSYLSGRSIRC